MYRYLKLSKSKGQFFMIAAVIIVSVLFSIYAVYLGYYSVDTSLVQDVESTYLLNDVELETKRLHKNYENASCVVINDMLNSSKIFYERSSLESGNSLRFLYNNSRGCVRSDFFLEVKTRDSRAYKNLSLTVPSTVSNWRMHDATSFGGGAGYSIVSESGIDRSSGVLKLQTGFDIGEITYEYDPTKKVIWHNHTINLFQPDLTEVILTWFPDDSTECGGGPEFSCSYGKFDDLPLEFRKLRQKIELIRSSGVETPIVNSTNVTYATRP